MTESVLYNPAFVKPAPFSRFLRWWKPDYKIIPANFAAGFLGGLVEGQLTATGHTEVGFYMEAAPMLTYVASRLLFMDGFSQSPDPKKLCGSAFVAAYMGSLAGDIMRLYAIKPHDYIPTIVTHSIAKTLVAIIFGSKFERNAPPPSLSA